MKSQLLITVLCWYIRESIAQHFPDQATINVASRPFPMVPQFSE